MAWILFVLLAPIGLIAYVVYSAPEVDDDYEVQLQDYYKRETIEANRAELESRPSCDGDAL